MEHTHTMNHPVHDTIHDTDYISHKSYFPIEEINIPAPTTYPMGALDPSANADDILSGYAQGSGNGSPITLTYKFHQSYQSYWSLDTQFYYQTNGMSGFTTNQKNAVYNILDELSSFTNITFNEVSGNSNPQIGFINAFDTDNSNTLGGSAYYPTGWAGAGDVFINKNFWGYDGTASQGDVNYYILLHEIGHTLGLEHAFSAELSGIENTEQYTVMAYDTSPWGNSVYASSYMLYDIYSLQQLYGANTDYNNGDTTYVLNAGQAYTIWDGGGIDTMDGAHLVTDIIINLDAGTFSSVGLTNNIAIAYNVVMENANGGEGNDTFYGNSAANIISGNQGDDTFYGSAGNDTFNGGIGSDLLIYDQLIDDLLFSLVDPTTLEIQEGLSQLWTDTVTEIEDFIFGGVSYSWNELMDYIDPSAPDPEPQPYAFTLEAEDMTLAGGYVVANNSGASGGKNVEIAIADAEGTISTTFDGIDGQYNLEIAYFDEMDAAPTYTLYINGIEKDSWVADGIFGSYYANAQTLTSHMTENLDLQQGDLIELVSTRIAVERNEVDSFAFTPTSGDGEPPAPPPVPEGEPIFIEAEDMDLGGSYVIAGNFDASGNKNVEISNPGASGTIETPFSGEDGIYTLDISYFDELDQSIPFSLSVNGDIVFTWDADGTGGTFYANAGSLTTETITGLSLENGDVVTLSATRIENERAEVDSFTFTKTGDIQNIEISEPLYFFDDIDQAMLNLHTDEGNNFDTFETLSYLDELLHVDNALQEALDEFSAQNAAADFIEACPPAHSLCSDFFQPQGSSDVDEQNSQGFIL